MEPFSVLAILTFIKDVLEQVRALKDTIDQVNIIHQFLWSISRINEQLTSRCYHIGF
jgi:hypothetical protein